MITFENGEERILSKGEGVSRASAEYAAIRNYISKWSFINNLVKIIIIFFTKRFFKFA